ncbi:FMN-binding negative transcriptional regulator [uncultured Sphingomonas sp.]|jgi:transcriptional regulator|uniref:FMN-binding negative transcriptional regulator n=1 Tax=uncultured Sphingomonas sp. TaxID=158754 RepID=UPI0030DAA92B
MHPDPAFAIDTAACRTVARRLGFAQVALSAGGRLALVHAPLVLAGDDTLTFHLSRRNRALPIADGTPAIAGFVATDFYVSPDWYVVDGQVPTWNYVAVEAEGTITALDDDALIAQIDALGAEQEARLAPKPPWTRAKMPDGRFDAMRRAIAGFTLSIAAWRGTAKLSQNKSAPDRAGAIAGLRAAGHDDAASWMESGVAAGDVRRQTAVTAPSITPQPA